MTLHRAIHSKLHDIPVPNGKDCKRAYDELKKRELLGIISEEDTPVQRLDFLIEMFEETCPATTAMLAWERQIIDKFYKNAP